MNLPTAQRPHSRRPARGALLWACLLLLPCVATAQPAGMNTLSLLDEGATARAAALGMDYLSLRGADASVALANPSLLDGSHGGTLLASFVSQFAGGSRGAIAYAHNTKRAGSLLFGFQYNSYGVFEGYDEEGNREGQFGAADYMLTVGWGMQIDSCFGVGVNLKPVLSQYEQYTALALAVDVAGNYTSPDRRFSATLMARNAGAQVMTFDQSVEKLPFELSAALSYKLARAPFRLFLALTELQRWSLRYEDPLNPSVETDPFTGEVTRQGWLQSTVDNLMRHAVVGIELNLGSNLFARVGYNYRQQAEMRAADAFNLSGFSFGFGLRTKRFEFAFARRNYHLSQAPTYFTIACRL